jgi:hypothetical protein
MSEYLANVDELGRSILQEREGGVIAEEGGGVRHDLWMTHYGSTEPVKVLGSVS